MLKKHVGFNVSLSISKLIKKLSLRLATNLTILLMEDFSPRVDIENITVVWVYISQVVSRMSSINSITAGIVGLAPEVWGFRVGSTTSSGPWHGKSFRNSWVTV